MSVEMICHCGLPYQAKEGDLARGWGLSCSKSCAAFRKTYRRPAAKRADGLKIRRNGQSVLKRIRSQQRQEKKVDDYRKYDDEHLMSGAAVQGDW
ncbi:hypothetical protein [Carnimonas bestiolae]|uniref:hypothetical protein n=1 Tax=Carnimonas bestiolae TaxID=3402172 RepID=UPI003EDBF21D